MRCFAMVYPTYDNKKASTKLAYIYLILNEIKATQPTTGQSQILRWWRKPLPALPQDL